MGDSVLPANLIWGINIACGTLVERTSIFTRVCSLKDV